MNFSPYIFIIPDKYLSNDEREMIEEAEKLETEAKNESLYEL